MVCGGEVNVVRKAILYSLSTVSWPLSQSPVVKTKTITISDVTNSLRSEITTKDIPIVHTETKTITYESAQVRGVVFWINPVVWCEDCCVAVIIFVCPGFLFLCQYLSEFVTNGMNLSLGCKLLSASINTYCYPYRTVLVIVLLIGIGQCWIFNWPIFDFGSFAYIGTHLYSEQHIAVQNLLFCAACIQFLL